MILAYPGGLDVITGCPDGKERGRESEQEGGQSNGETTAQVFGHFETGRGKRVESPLELPEGTWPYRST